jgi:hypothetical protein
MSTELVFENAQLKGRVITLDAEVKCLEAVIRAHERIDCRAVTNLKKQLVEADAENARLKAEVERLTSVSEAWKKRRLDKVESECINWADVEKENARLKAEVERLTKAASQVYQELDEFGQVSAKSVHELRDAAKGVQS